MLERKQFRAEVKAAGDAGDFEAVIATLNVVDHDGDVIAPGAFGNATVSIVPAHNHESVPLGKARIEERGDRAVAVGKFNLDIRAAKDWHSALKFDLANGEPVQEWSFAFKTLQKMDEIRAGERIRILQRLDTMEVSPVLRGAGMGTGTLAVKGRLSIDPQIARAQQDYYDECKAAGEPGELLTEAEVKSFLDRQSRKDRARSSTYDAKRFASSKPFQYVYCDVDADERKAACSMAKLAAAALGIERPPVKFFRAARTGEAPDYGRDKDIRGFADTENRVIYLRCRDERSNGSTLGIVAHECRHLYQEAKGFDMWNTKSIESDAHAYDEHFTSMLSLPEYAEVEIGEGDPPMKFGDAGSLFGAFWFDRKSGHVYAADGDAPWPRWRYVGMVPPQ